MDSGSLSPKLIPPPRAQEASSLLKDFILFFNRVVCRGTSAFQGIYAHFYSFGKTNLKRGTKPVWRALYTLGSPLISPAEELGVGSSRTFPEHNFQTDLRCLFPSLAGTTVLTADSEFDSNKEKNVTSEQPPTARAAGGAEEALAPDRTPARTYTPVHTPRRTMTRCKKAGKWLPRLRVLPWC